MKYLLLVGLIYIININVNGQGNFIEGKWKLQSIYSNKHSHVNLGVKPDKLDHIYLFRTNGTGFNCFEEQEFVYEISADTLLIDELKFKIVQKSESEIKLEANKEGVIWTWLFKRSN
jgi:hypothetical protein